MRPILLEKKKWKPEIKDSWMTFFSSIVKVFSFCFVSLSIVLVTTVMLILKRGENHNSMSYSDTLNHCFVKGDEEE